jgi:polysaccharide biosynthesis protein PelD
MDLVTEGLIQERFENNKSLGLLGMRLSAWLELGVFMISALIIDQVGLDGTRFMDVSPHPFWIIILLLAVQYGVVAGMMAAGVSIAVYLVANPAIPISAFLSEDTYQLPLLWLVAALVLGEIRQRHIRESMRLNSRLADALSRESVTAQAYQEVRSRKQNLEERMASDMRSALTVYQAAKSMETMSPPQLMRAIETVVRELTTAKSFSLFMLDGQGLNAVIVSGWDEVNSKLARRIDSSSLLYEMIVGRRELITIANETHAAALAGEGVMAAPVIARTGEVLGMLKIESLPFHYMGVQAVETLRSVADWTAQALLNLRQFEEALADAMTDPRSQMMTRTYFDRHTQYLKSLGQRASFPVSMLTLSLDTTETLTEELQIKLACAVRIAVKECLRAVDLAFDYQQSGSDYSIVLPVTNVQGAGVVKQKLSNSLERELAAQGLRCGFTTSVQVIVP